MKRIDELQISEGQSKEMWWKSIMVPKLKDPAQSCVWVRGKLDAR